MGIDLKYSYGKSIEVFSDDTLNNTVLASFHVKRLLKLTKEHDYKLYLRLSPHMQVAKIYDKKQGFITVGSNVTIVKMIQDRLKEIK